MSDRKRLIALDLDGSFFGDNASISERNRRAIKMVNEKGHQIIANTGRSFWSATGLLEAVPEIETIICSNGSYQYSRSKASIVRSDAIKIADVAFLESELNSICPSVCFGRESSEGIFYSDDFEKAAGGAHTLEQGGIKDRLDNKPIYKYYVRSTEISHHELAELIAPLLRDKVECSTSGAPFLEITAKGVNKGKALYQAANHFGFDMQDTIVFGDNSNDIAAFSVAGISVAMGNAIAEVQDIADKVAPANVDDGVAVVLEQLFNS